MSSTEMRNASCLPSDLTLIVYICRNVMKKNKHNNLQQLSHCVFPSELYFFACQGLMHSLYAFIVSVISLKGQSNKQSMSFYHMFCCFCPKHWSANFCSSTFL